jgi:ATPase family associated with various cellular activities (AAA)
MGQVYYDMGFLSSSEVIECSASDLVGQYVGHTGPKAKKLFEKALGRVLFIDEAYRLGEGHFAQEAVDEMVGMLTQEKFKSKIVVILAGYDQEMNKLMAVNTGLSSRFPEEIVLKNFPPEKCLEVLNKELRKMNVLVAELEDQSCVEYQTMVDIVQSLSTLPSWGNARDMITLSKQMASQAIQASKDRPADTQLSFTGKDAIECTKAMLSDKQDRSTNLPIGSRLKSVDIPQINPLPAPPPPIAAARVTKTAPVTAQQKTSAPKN